MLAWILVLAFLWTTAGFAILWLFTRKKLIKLKAESDLATSRDVSSTGHPSRPPPQKSSQQAGHSNNQESSHQAPLAAGKSVATLEDSDYKLLDLNSTIIDDEEYYFGVVRKETGNAETTDASTPSSFIIKDDISHLTAGDSFTSRKGKVMKLDNGSQPSQNNIATNSGSASTPASSPDQGKTVFNQVATEKPKDATDSLPYLEVLEGPDAGAKFHLSYTTSMIGRDFENEITLSDEGLSRKHCYLEWTGNIFRICDNGSTNGTSCNDKSVTAHALEFNDVITISDTRLQYTCKAMQVKQEEPGKAIELLKDSVALQPDFLTALQHLAYLMERDLRLKKEAAPLWKKISKLEKKQEKHKNKPGKLQVSN